MASPERGRQFIPFAALRGYDEMLEEVELRAAGAGGARLGSRCREGAPRAQK